MLHIAEEDHGTGDTIIRRGTNEDLRFRLFCELTNVGQHVIISRQLISFGEAIEGRINLDHKSSDKGIFFSPGISDRKHYLVFGVYNDGNISKDAAVPIDLNEPVVVTPGQRLISAMSWQHKRPIRGELCHEGDGLSDDFSESSLPDFPVLPINKTIIFPKSFRFNKPESKPFIETMRLCVAGEWVNHNRSDSLAAKATFNGKLHHFRPIALPQIFFFADPDIDGPKRFSQKQSFPSTPVAQPITIGDFEVYRIRLPI